MDAKLTSEITEKRKTLFWGPYNVINTYFYKFMTFRSNHLALVQSSFLKRHYHQTQNLNLTI